MGFCAVSQLVDLQAARLHRRKRSKRKDRVISIKPRQKALAFYPLTHLGLRKATPFIAFESSVVPWRTSLMARDSARGCVLFTDEELNEIAGVKKGEDFVEVTCGCTSPRYGDAVGRLRVFASGKLEVACECTPGCREDKLTPSAFEKHTGRESQRRWKYYVWVIVKGKKIPLLKTALLKYHEKVYGGSSHRGHKGRSFHRDEFVRCSRCNKERRFRLQTKVGCRTYHDAVLDANWKCSDLPSDEYSCDDEEERASRRSIRGCSRTALCKGCTLCVCFGCELCRFPDCTCQACIDFVNNSAN